MNVSKPPQNKRTVNPYYVTCEDNLTKEGRYRPSLELKAASRLVEYAPDGIYHVKARL